jgi:hypothetical protein
LLIRVWFERHVGIDFPQRDLDADDRQAQNLVILDGLGDPVRAAAAEDLRAGMGLLQDDVMPDRGCRQLFGVLEDEIVMGCARAEDLEDHNRIAHNMDAARLCCADDEGIRISDPPSDLDLEFATNHSAPFTPQPGAQGKDDIDLNRRVHEACARHRYRLDPIEFVSQLLPFFPGEELFQCHGLVERDVHGCYAITERSHGSDYLDRLLP